MNAERILQNLFARDAEQRFDTKVKCPTGQASLWVKFPTVWSKTPVKCPGYALGGGWGGEMGGYGIDWYIAVLSTFKTTGKTV